MKNVYVCNKLEDLALIFLINFSTSTGIEKLISMIRKSSLPERTGASPLRTYPKTTEILLLDNKYFESIIKVENEYFRISNHRYVKDTGGQNYSQRSLASLRFQIVIDPKQLIQQAKEHYLSGIIRQFKFKKTFLHQNYSLLKI